MSLEGNRRYMRHYLKRVKKGKNRTENKSKMLKLMGKIGIASMQIVCFIIIAVALLVMFGARWAVDTFDNLSMDSLLYEVMSPIQGAHSGFITGFIKDVVVPSGLLLIGFILLFYMSQFCIHKFLKVKKFVPNIVIAVVSLALFVTSYFTIPKSLGLVEYVKGMNSVSEYMKDNFVDPKLAKISFPEQKRNLVHIYVESLETTYMSKSMGGAYSANLLPNLTKLSEEGYSFSNTDKFGGARQCLVGTGWTVAGMVNQSAGLPLIMSKGGWDINDRSTWAGNDNEQETNFLPGMTNLGDILKDNGYYQELFIGSKAIFGGRRQLYEQHGNYNIFDYDTFIEKGLIPSDYYVWWGVEDEKLFKAAKDELTEVANKNQPFNFTMLTTDTHHVGGYKCELCEDTYPEQYANAIACSDRQISEFVKWIQAQPFYENTTIVVTGDHLSMDSDFFKTIGATGSNYERTVFGFILNPSPSLDTSDTKFKDRQYTVMDDFPTIMASLGATWEGGGGDRLGLGTNLFSERPTLIERDGVEKVNSELRKKSKFYFENILKEDIDKNEDK